MSPRDVLARLRDIQDALASIALYAPSLASDDARETDMAIDAVKYHLVVIGEAVGSLDAQTRAGAPEVAWTSIKGVRNILAHAYFAVDLQKIREIVDGPDLAALDSAVRAILSDSGAA